MNKPLQVEMSLRKLNLLLMDCTKYDDDRYALIADVIHTFNSLPAIEYYYQHRQEMNEMVSCQGPIEEILGFQRGNSKGKKHYRDLIK